MYYDMQGNPISMMKWARGFESKERQVHYTETRLLWISTVLLGLDHNFGSGPPVIFETMVFSKFGSRRFNSWFSIATSLDMDRYCTLAEAKGGHLKMVRKWSGFGGFILLVKGIWEAL